MWGGQEGDHPLEKAARYSVSVPREALGQLQEMKNDYRLYWHRETGFTSCANRFAYPLAILSSVLNTEMYTTCTQR